MNFNRKRRLSQVTALCQRGLFAFSVVVLLTALPATSWAITYNVNRSIGGGSITGFVQTDGTLGPLNFSNIVDWNLLLDDTIGTFNLQGLQSGNNSGVLIVGNAYVATTTDLFFNFSVAEGAAVLYQNPAPGSGMNFYCMDDAVGLCSGHPSAESFSVITTLVEQRGGIISVATVPEPSAIVLLIAGLTSIGWRRRRASVA